MPQSNPFCPSTGEALIGPRIIFMAAQRVARINGLTAFTPAVVEAARENLVIGLA